MVCTIAPPRHYKARAKTPPTLAALARAIADPAFELDADEAAVIVSAVARAQAGGATIDPLALALVNVLRRQLADATGDRDDADLAEGDGQTFADPSAVYRDGRRVA
jgi:hypothetical protein